VNRLAGVPVRFTWLRAFAQSAAHALHAAQHGKDASPAMKLGKNTHAAAFEPDKIVVYRGGTKIDTKGKPKVYTDVKQGGFWEDFKASQRPDAVIVNAKELARAEAIAASLHRADAERVHPDTGEPLPLLFGPGVIREQNIRWSRNGRACSSTPDARLPGRWIADLKVARTCDPERYPRDATRQGYPAQLVMYDEADAYERTGDHRNVACELYSVVVEPVEPYVVTTYRLTASAVASGGRMLATWWSALNACEASDHWPGYAQSVVEFHVDDPLAMLDGFEIDAAADDEAANGNADSGDDTQQIDWSAA